MLFLSKNNCFLNLIELTIRLFRPRRMRLWSKSSFALALARLPFMGRGVSPSPSFTTPLKWVWIIHHRCGVTLNFINKNSTQIKWNFFIRVKFDLFEFHSGNFWFIRATLVKTSVLWCHFDCRFNKFSKQRVRAQGPGFEFGMKLGGDKKWMAGNFYYFH